MIQWDFWLLGMIFSVICIVNLWALFWVNPGMVGFIDDTVLYINGAQSLSNGYGYTLFPFLDAGAIVKYPPLFSLLLSSFWQVAPSFPDNIPILRIVPYFCFIASLFLLIPLGRRQGLNTLSVASMLLLIGINPLFIWHNLNIMSESLFLLLSIILISYCSATKKLSLWVLLLGSVAVFYTRSVGAILILAIMMWLFLQKKYQQTIQYVLSMGVLCLPWVLWTQSHSAPLFHASGMTFLPFTATYFQEWNFRLQQSHSFFELYTQGIIGILRGIGQSIYPVFEIYLPSGFLLGSVLLLIFLIRDFITSIRERQFSLMGIYLVLYLSLIPFWWASETMGVRFLLVVLPFFLILLLKSVKLFQPGVKGQIIFGLLVFFALSGNIIKLTQWMNYYTTPRNGYPFSDIDVWTEYQEIFSDMERHSPPGSVFYASQNPLLFMLYGNRKVVGYYGMQITQKKHMEWGEGMNVMRRMLEENRVQYVILDRNKFQGDQYLGIRNSLMEEMIRRKPNWFRLEAVSPHKTIELFRLEPL